MKDQWIKWQPNISVQRKYFIKKIVDDESGLHVFLVSVEDNSKICIEFPGIVYAYRSVDELSALGTMDHVVDEKGHFMASDWTFFLVEKSSYIDIIKNSSKGVYFDYDLIHFAVISGESLLEVITDMLPHFIEGWENGDTSTFSPNHYFP